jgi:predicted XRE-type DNA-binding protein
MAKKRTEVEAGTGNVFADLGYADARERTLKVELAIEVNRILGERALAQAETAKLLGLRQPHVSDLARYRLNRFSVERLLDS